MTGSDSADSAVGKYQLIAELGHGGMRRSMPQNGRTFLADVKVTYP